MALKLITPPDGEIITLEEAKKFMRVDDSDNDELISALIQSAREQIEGPGKLNAVFLQQTWDLVLDKFPSHEIMLPLTPVQYVTEIVYFDEDGAEQTVDGSSYYLDNVSRPPFVLPIADVSWPDVLNTANAMRVRFVAGYPIGGSGESDTINVPARVKLAVRQLVSHWYERRDLVSEATNLNIVPEFVWTLLHKSRMFI